MGSTFVFTYLLIGAMVAPVAWVIWWAAASLGQPRHLHAAPGAAVARTRAAARPTPVDGRFQGRAGEVVIRRLSDGLEIGSCHGPDPSGKCPRIQADGTVPCAGTILALPRPVRGSLEWQIPAAYHTCLLGSYDTFRQPGAAR